jgi:hypothetical protein
MFKSEGLIGAANIFNEMSFGPTGPEDATSTRLRRIQTIRSYRRRRKKRVGGRRALLENSSWGTTSFMNNCGSKGSLT